LSARCELYDLVRARLEASHQGERAVRPTSLLWWIFDRAVKDALVIDDLVAYVVSSSRVTADQVRNAISIGVDVGMRDVIVFAHEGANVDLEAKSEAEENGVKIEFIAERGCPRSAV
jgi:hypothetical protein